eukprot:1045320-Pyramimonas_sp.AAC.1
MNADNLKYLSSLIQSRALSCTDVSPIDSTDENRRKLAQAISIRLRLRAHSNPYAQELLTAAFVKNLHRVLRGGGAEENTFSLADLKGSEQRLPGTVRKHPMKKSVATDP